MQPGNQQFQGATIGRNLFLQRGPLHGLSPWQRLDLL